MARSGVEYGHQFSFLPGQKDFFGQGFVARNNDALVMTKGSGVIFAFPAQTTTLDTAVPVSMVAAAAADTRRKVAGMVYGHDIQPGETGIVTTFARVSTLLVTGTVAVMDWLCLSGTRAGASRPATTTERSAWALALGVHSGAASGIPALILPWRI